MYRNKNTSLVLTDQEYWSMREREMEEEWRNMTEKERQEWKSYQEFEKWDLERNIDLDFEYIED